MTDRLSPEARSEHMRRIRGKNTAPEMLVRRGLHAMGLRFRVHRADLPGHPDIVLPKWRTVIFVHGCFWHRHKGCARATMPSTRQEFWTAKFARTVERDAEQEAALRALSWRVEVIWECETRKPDRLRLRLAAIPGDAGSPIGDAADCPLPERMGGFDLRATEP
jgi:DNA mismatch endonuclease (patch repair protein)